MSLHAHRFAGASALAFALALPTASVFAVTGARAADASDTAVATANVAGAIIATDDAVDAAMLAYAQDRGSDAVAHQSDAPAAPDAPSQRWALHFQGTFADQFHPAFASPYRGPNSLDPGARGDETTDVTVFAGVSLWKGMELWANPEMDQGFGLSDTLGIAGFPSGEAYKIGKASPYYRLQRLFIRQTLDLGGESQVVDPDLNQLGGAHTANKIVVTAGKFSVPDIFDANSYAHDPRNDFMNWSIVDAGSFDYAADAWGYTPGVAVEWYQGPWVFRSAFMDMSTQPNSTRYDPTFAQHQFIAEVERDWSLKGLAGKIRVTGFDSHGRMASYKAAIAYGEETGGPPLVAPVRHMADRPGISFSFEQQLTSTLGAFVRAGTNDGSKEAFEFSDINRTVSAGLSLSGANWGRKDDTVGVAGVVNALSHDGLQYLADGGLGILVGDGTLPHPSTEKDFEAYYKIHLLQHLALTADYQLSVDPGYNADRGPVSIFGGRMHVQY
jgi:high affinity Mn2+ porin